MKYTVNIKQVGQYGREETRFYFETFEKAMEFVDAAVAATIYPIEATIEGEPVVFKRIPEKVEEDEE